MGKSQRRVLLYGVAACLAGALLFVGFVVKLPADIEQLLSNASFEVKMGAIQGAREHLHQVLAREPGHWKALWMDGYCAERQGKAGEALERYRAALPSIPQAVHREEVQASISRLETQKKP